MTVLLSSRSHIDVRKARAVTGSASAISTSNTLPWRTELTPSKPRLFSEPLMARPCGSRTPDLRVTVTRAFIAVSWLSRAGVPEGHRLVLLDQPRPRRQRVVGFHKNAQSLRDFPISVHQPAEILAEAVF